MQNRLCHFGLFLSVLLVPGIILAEAPPAVTRLQAGILNEAVAISWDHPSEQNIAYYRVYYSGQSILENRGVYDDFEATPGPATSYILQYKPNGKTMYIAILAVNEQGVEGEIFVEEAIAIAPMPIKDDAPITPTLQVQPNFIPPHTQQLPEQTPLETETFNIVTDAEKREEEPESSEAPPALPEWESRDLEGALHLLLTDVLSPTEVHLLFSVRPVVAPEYAPQAFSIMDTDGTPLRIESIYIDQENVTINTEIQTHGKEYEVLLKEPLQGIDGSPLHEINRKGSFVGHPEGKNEEQIPAPPVNQIPATSGIRSLQLTTSSFLDGTYTVIAKWEVDNPFNDLMYYSVRQTRDGGNIFGEAQVLPFSINGIEISGVTLGEYGLAVSAINMLGVTTPEVFSNINIGPQQAPLPQAPIAPPPVIEQTVMPVSTEVKKEELEVKHISTSDNLSQSGMGTVLGSIGTLGILIGWRKTRRKLLK